MKRFLSFIFAPLAFIAPARATFISATTFTPANQSAFGDLVTAENTPVLQLDFVYGINNQLGTASAANGATADTNAGRLRLQSGTSNNGVASFTSTRPAKYRTGQGITARFTTVFTTSAADSTQIAGMGNATDGYFVGYNGTAFGVAHRLNGSTTWTPQASWNGEGLGFNLDPSKGNVWMIRYPYLGYGAIHFFVLHPEGHWRRIHTIQYPNSSATVQLTNPNLQFYAATTNAGNTTNLTAYVASVGVFLNGQRAFLGPIFGTGARKTTITTEANVVTIRNATTYNGVANRSMIRLKTISVAWDNNSATCLLNVRKNSTLSGTTTFTAIDGTTANDGVTITSGNSVASVNTAAGFSGGTIQYNSAIGVNNSAPLDVTSQDLFIAPGETMTFTITGDASGAARVAINWVEDI